jgi:hypothetical protein
VYLNFPFSNNGNKHILDEISKFKPFNVAAIKAASLGISLIVM